MNYRKDITIIAVVDNINQDYETLQSDIKTISFVKLLENKNKEYQVIICNDNLNAIKDIEQSLVLNKINFLKDTISRYDIEYTVPKKLRFLFAIFLPILMIKDTSISLWNIISSLLNNKWKYLSGNTKRIAFNNLFYYTQSYNLNKFGRYGVSNILAGGNYELKKLFFTTPTSLKIQSTLGTTFIMFFSMCFWVSSWILLYQTNIQLPVLLLLSIFSTLFFSVFMEQENYNILGWMLFPVFLTFLISSNYIVLAITLFLIAVFSFTAFFISAILVSVSFLYTLDFYLLLVLMPGFIKLIIPIIVAFMNTTAINSVAGGIGIHNKTKYTRRKYKTLNIKNSYILGLMLQFLLLYIYSAGFNNISLLVLTISILFIINELVSRFADQQSFYIAYLSISIFALLNTEYDIYLYISYLFSIYPIYGYLLNMRCTGDSFITPGIKKPFNMEHIINDLNELYKDIPKGSKLFVAYKNPKGNYGKIFNGYRWFNEPIQYVATINDINLFPDWYMVLNNNKENSPEDFWVNNVKEIMSYMKRESIKYVIVPHFLYEEDMLSNFKLMGKHQLDFRDGMIYSKYKLYLLELKC